ncbi:MULTISPECIES: hypothetical protein [unclassified Bradyrhizobium]|uniref:hypothetical protein n=1 Tax=unclassified Bradyrhizobium TaxID=2631580 RepID=UPI00339719F2
MNSSSSEDDNSQEASQSRGGPARLQTIRENLQGWVIGHTSSWASAAFISLNFKDTLRADAGTFTGLTEQIARREIELFGKRVDRAVYGRLVQRFNRRVRRIPFLERGQDRGWHAHILMEPPDGMAEVRFLQIAKTAWAESPWSTNLHNRVADDGASGYLTKERSKSELEAWTDTIVVEAIVVDTK